MQGSLRTVSTALEGGRTCVGAGPRTLSAASHRHRGVLDQVPFVLKVYHPQFGSTCAMSSSDGTADAERPAGLDAAMQALCFCYRNPPPSSEVMPQAYTAIPQLIGRPTTSIGAIKMAVRRFGKDKTPRGRRTGWRKTTKADDACII